MTDLSEREKLVWLGLKRASSETRPLSKEIGLLKEHVGDWDSYETLVGDSADLETHETALVDAGWGEDDAAAFTTKIDEEFSNWGEYQSFVVNDAGSYRGLRNGFSTSKVFSGEGRTSGRQPTAGVRVHDTAGVTYGGERVPPGTVEVFGNQVHISKQEAPEGGFASMSYSNMQASTQTPEMYEEVEFSATITNEGSVSGTVEPRLRIDGRIVETLGRTVEVAPGASLSVTIPWTFDRLEQIDATIGDADPVIVTVFPEGMT